MNHFTIAESDSPVYSHAFAGTLTVDELRRRTPAVFAAQASERTKPTYRFINTASVLEAYIPHIAGHNLARISAGPISRRRPCSGDAEEVEDPESADL